MKNVLMSGMVVFFIALLLQGCSSGGSAAPTPTAGSTATTTPSPTPASGGEGLLEKIKKAGVLKWGADANSGAPFVFKENDKNIGFEVEMMEKLAAHMGLKDELVQGQWEMLPNELDRKSCDIVVNGFEINEERKAKYDFSDVYYEYEQQLAVRIEDKDKYQNLADLKGHKIGTLKDAEANNVLKRAGFTDEQLVPLQDSDTPYKDLELKRTDAVVQENIITAYYAGKNPKLFLVPKTFAPGQYGIMVRKGNPELIQELNKAIALMKSNGELAAIYKKWNMLSDIQKTIGIVEK